MSSGGQKLVTASTLGSLELRDCQEEGEDKVGRVNDVEGVVEVGLELDFM